MLSGVRRWTAAEIESDAALASADFRRRRLGEPLLRYVEAFDAAEPMVREWMAEIDTVFAGGPGALHRARKLLGSDPGRAVLRYLGAPPISEDDLETLAECSLTASVGDDDRLQRVLAVVRVILDPRRFPWLASTPALPASTASQYAATLATCALMASQRVQTLRRSHEKSAVEGGVRGLLIGMGWAEAAKRPAGGIQSLVTDSPQPRTFVTQTNLGTDNADVVVRLDDGRLLAIECKGSNSEINSRKRLNKEAAHNARAWLARFGQTQVVPAVALQGVFKARYVVEVQETPMAVYWGHRLDDLRAFVAAARRP